MKRWPERASGVTALLLVVALILGCGGFQQAVQEVKKIDHLTKIAMAYGAYRTKNNDQSPSKAADLKPFIDDADAYADLEGGQFVVVWDADFDAMKGKGPAAYVLAYEKTVPAGEGLVLMADLAAINHQTAAEFNALPKAPTKAPGGK
jgi:hypothetical protein